MPRKKAKPPTPALAALHTEGDCCSSITYRALLVPSGVGVSGPTARAAWDKLAELAGCDLVPADTETEILLGSLDDL